MIILLNMSNVVAQDDDVELRIDFTSGAVIANETPKVIKLIDDITALLGTKDTTVADLNEIFHDAENGTALSFGAKVLDPSFVNVKINRFDSVATLQFKTATIGRTKIIFSASDGLKEVYDTIEVVMKESFKLSDTLNDTIVKSSYSIVAINMDISHIFPKDSLSEKYDFSVMSSDPALVRVYANNLSKSITLEIADSSYGKAEIVVAIIDSDKLIVRDTFLVDVRKSYSREDYKRKNVIVNPGVTFYTDIEYSGALFKLWFKDVFGIAAGGYYLWNQDGLGFEGQLLLKPALQIPLHPYIMVSGGYHYQAIDNSFKDVYSGVERELSIFAFRVAGGADVWIGKSKHHVIGVEAGYCYGKSEYYAPTKTTIGSVDVERTKSSFKLNPLHVRVSYSVFIRKL